MNMLKKILFSSAILTATAALAYPSWCHNARSSVERSICEHPSLASMDDQLNDLYARAKGELI
jgi:uncharacterized protein